MSQGMHGFSRLQPIWHAIQGNQLVNFNGKLPGIALQVAGVVAGLRQLGERSPHRRGKIAYPGSVWQPLL